MLRDSMIFVEEQQGTGSKGLRNSTECVLRPLRNLTHVTNLGTNEPPSTLSASSSKGGAGKNNSHAENNNNPFPPLQETLSGIDGFLKSTSKHSFFYLSKCLSSSFAEENKELNIMRTKLTEAREAWCFAKEIGNDKNTMKKINVEIDLEYDVEENMSKYK